MMWVFLPQPFWPPGRALNCPERRKWSKTLPDTICPKVFRGAPEVDLVSEDTDDNDCKSLNVVLKVKRALTHVISAQQVLLYFTPSGDQKECTLYQIYFIHKSSEDYNY